MTATYLLKEAAAAGTNVVIDTDGKLRVRREGDTRNATVFLAGEAIPADTEVLVDGGILWPRPTATLESTLDEALAARDAVARLLELGEATELERLGELLLGAGTSLATALDGIIADLRFDR